MEEKRDKRLLIKLTQHELDLINRNMKAVNIKNRSGYIRKMCIDGYHLSLDIPEMKEVSRLLNITSNNVNQIAKMANATGNIYQDDVLDLKSDMDNIKLQFGKILESLSKIGA